MLSWLTSITDPMYRLLWKWFRKGLLKHYLKEQNKPTGFQDLQYAFTDQEGRKYYRFTDQLSLPVQRFNQMQEYQMWMSARLTADNLHTLVDKALEIVSNGVAQGNNSAKVSAILYQIRERQDKIVPAQVLLNILAVQYVREDEDPLVFDGDIQNQKVQAFLDDAQLANGFFLNLPELKKLTTLVSISPIDWMEYYRESEVDQEVIKRSLKIYSQSK